MPALLALPFGSFWLESAFGFSWSLPSRKSLYGIASIAFFSLSHHATHFAVLLVMLPFAVATARVLFRFLFAAGLPSSSLRIFDAHYYEHPHSTASES